MLTRKFIFIVLCFQFLCYYSKHDQQDHQLRCHQFRSSNHHQFSGMGPWGRNSLRHGKLNVWICLIFHPITQHIKRMRQIKRMTAPSLGMIFQTFLDRTVFLPKDTCEGLQRIVAHVFHAHRGWDGSSRSEFAYPRNACSAKRAVTTNPLGLITYMVHAIHPIFWCVFLYSATVEAPIWAMIFRFLVFFFIAIQKTCHNVETPKI